MPPRGSRQRLFSAQQQGLCRVDTEMFRRRGQSPAMHEEETSPCRRETVAALLLYRHALCGLAGGKEGSALWRKIHRDEEAPA